MAVVNQMMVVLVLEHLEMVVANWVMVLVLEQMGTGTGMGCLVVNQAMALVLEHQGMGVECLVVNQAMVLV